MAGHYNIAFTGLGSIGKRHVANVVAFLSSRGSTFGLDLYRSSLQKPLPYEQVSQIRAVHLFADPLPDGVMYDAVFVTNPTAMHLDTLWKFAGHTKAFFIEKPLFDKVAVDPAIFSALKGADCYVACPMRYNPVLVYVKEHIDLSSVISARAISSSYLPDWRPGQDYRQCYSAHRDMGGGVGMDLIHEWDYITWLFGMPLESHAILGKFSSLEVDSDDLAVYIARTERTAIEIHLDYFGRWPIRTLELFLPEETVFCDLISGEVHYRKSGRFHHLNGDRNSFQMREIEHFFQIIDHQVESDSTPEHAYDVLKLAKGL